MRGYRNFNPDPSPGELKHRVTIGTTENVINANGYPQPTDKVICRVWAGIDDAGNNEIVAADVRNLDDSINVTIRWRSDVKVGMWVEFDGERRVITQLGRYQYKRAYLGIKCRYNQAVGS